MPGAEQDTSHFFDTSMDSTRFSAYICRIMSKILIIHPQDPSTSFLKPIYTRIKNKTIITGGINKEELKKQIELHDRVIMLGHGSPMGLFSVIPI